MAANIISITIIEAVHDHGAGGHEADAPGTAFDAQAVVAADEHEDNGEEEPFQETLKDVADARGGERLVEPVIPAEAEKPDVPQSMPPRTPENMPRATRQGMTTTRATSFRAANGLR